MRHSFLRIVLRASPTAIAAIGVAAAIALGWFSYMYIYRTITTAHAAALLQPPLVAEFIDPKRVETADAFLRAAAALPPIDPATVRNVFSRTSAAPVERNAHGSPARGSP